MCVNAHATIYKTAGRIVLATEKKKAVFPLAILRQ